jgi:MFS family permease
VLTAAAQLALAAAPNFGMAVAAVVLLGLAFEVYEPPSQALIAEEAPTDVRTAAYGRMSAGMSAAAVVSGLIAAAVGAVDVRLLFVFDATSCLACAALMRFTLPARRHPVNKAEAAKERADHRSLARPWRDRRLLALLALGIVFASLYLQLNVTLPLTLVDRGIPVSRLGLLLSLGAVTVLLAQPLLTKGRLARADDVGAMCAGYAVLGTGLLANGLASSLWQFALATVLWSIGALILMGRAYNLVAAISPEHGHARYFSVYGLCWGVAAVLGPLAGTQILTRLGPAGLWTGCAIACGLLAAIQLPMRHLIASDIAPQASDIAPQKEAVKQSAGQET